MIEISVTGLQKSFDLEKKILDGLTFQINSGERVGLLGKNGAGRNVMAFQPPLVITEQNVDDVLDELDRVLTEKHL